MNWETLVNEGVRLCRPVVALRRTGTGEPAARWYGPEAFEVDENDLRCWLTISSSWIPCLKKTEPKFLSVFSDDMNDSEGYVETSAKWPERDGIDLFAEEIDLLPPIEAIFLLGSDAVAAWLRENNWNRNWPFSMSFKDKLASRYVSQWERSHPFYQKETDICALLGGWPQIWPENDWYDLVDKDLCILTLEESEPWIEVWRGENDAFKVIRRIT